MLFRVRRWIAVMLSLALLPTLSGGAQCASHGSGRIVVSEGALAVSTQPGAESGRQHAEHESRNLDERISTAASPQSTAQGTTWAPAQTTTEQAQQDRCPPTSVPGACSSAMGCGVVSVAETVTGGAAINNRRAVDAAPGSVLPPGPLHAPDVPPPRA